MSESAMDKVHQLEVDQSEIKGRQKELGVWLPQMLASFQNTERDLKQELRSFKNTVIVVGVAVILSLLGVVATLGTAILNS